MSGIERERDQVFADGGRELKAMTGEPGAKDDSGYGRMAIHDEISVRGHRVETDSLLPNPVGGRRKEALDH